jgi:hypothetical protein
MNPPQKDVNIWSSPNIGQMTEMSQDWYRKIMADSAEQLKIVLDNTHFRPLTLDDYSLPLELGDSSHLNFSHQQSQPQSQSNQYDHQEFYSENESSLFPFNSFPIELNQLGSDDMDLPEIPIFSSPQDQKMTFSNFSNSFATPEQSSHPSTRPGSTQYSPNKVFKGYSATTRGRKYHNSNILAHSCQVVLNETAHPSFSQIADIVNQLKTSLGSAAKSDKKIRSNVREWFRKRREYMATKVYRCCERLLPKFATGNNMNEFLKSIQANKPLIGLIMIESKLPMKFEEERIQFVKEKIADYYLKYPQRKLRNANNNNNNNNNYLK